MLGLLLGCSSVPTASDGRKFYAAQGEAQDNLFKVKSFTKINGQGDDEVYQVEYEAELECLRSNAVTPGGIRFDPGFSADCPHQGYIDKKKGVLVFVKTEKGWMVSPDGSY